MCKVSRMNTNLFQQLCQPQNLLLAWQKVRKKGSAGGIDRQSIQDFEREESELLEEIRQDLLSGSYIPEPYLEVKIPKDEGEFRTLGLHSVKDKIVQQAVRDQIEPILDKVFLDISYGYRPRKGAVKAIRRTQYWIRHKKMNWLTRCDIDSYFDNIDHDILLELLRKHISQEEILHLIQLWIGMARVGKDLEWQEVKKGVPQGMLLSPVLSNLYLHELDTFIIRQGYGFVRYADDFIVLNPYEKLAHEALVSIRAFLHHKLKLALNPGARVHRVEKGFTFLGVKLHGAEVSLAEAKQYEICQSLEEEFSWKEDKPHQEYLAKVRSLQSYYGKILPEHTRQQLDEALIRGIILGGRKAISRRKEIRTRIIPLAFEDLNFFSTHYQEKEQATIQRMVKGIRARENPYQVSETSTTDLGVIQKLRKQKRRYQRKASRQRDLLVTVPGVFLGKSRKKIIVKQRGKKLYEMPLEQLEHVTVQASGVSFSTNLLKECAKRKISIDFLQFDGRPYARMMAPVSASASVGLAQLSAYENGKGAYLSIQIVKGKLKNQRNLLKYINKYHKKDDEVHQEYVQGLLERMEYELERVDDIQAPDLEILRGKLFAAEGRAAAAYWEYVQEILSEKIAFPGRERKGAKDPVNSALNYGYAFLYSRVWEAVSRAQLHSGLSYLHAPNDADPSLVFDLVELFRAQAVDRAVFALIRTTHIPEVKKGFLIPESRREVSQAVLEQLNRYETFRSQELSLQDIIMKQVNAYAAYLTGERNTFLPYIAKY